MTILDSSAMPGYTESFSSVFLGFHYGLLNFMVAIVQSLINWCIFVFVLWWNVGESNFRQLYFRILPFVCPVHSLQCEFPTCAIRMSDCRQSDFAIYKVENNAKYFARDVA